MNTLKAFLAGIVGVVAYGALLALFFWMVGVILFGCVKMMGG